MTYSPSIPDATDVPSASQAQLLTNFGQLNTIFSANHYEFDNATVALRGKHKYSVYPLQAAGPATTATEGALYTKNYGGAPNLYYRTASSGAEILMTCNTTPSNAINGYTFLPGGLLLQWGQGRAAGGNTDVFFPTAFGGAPHSINVTLFRSSGGTVQSLYVSSDIAPDTVHFVVYKSGGAQNFKWMAIGPR